MSSSQASPTRPVAAPPQSEAYVLSLLSEGRFDVALEVIPEFGDGRAYWPDFHNHAQRLLASGKLEPAAAALDAAISLDSGRPQAYETLGELRLRHGRWPEAEESFRRALALGPKSSTARYGMGRALRQQGKRRQALEALVAAMEANPRQEWTRELQRALRRGNARVEAQGLAPLRDRAQRAIDRLQLDTDARRGRRARQCGRAQGVPRNRHRREGLHPAHPHTAPRKGGRDHR